MDTANTPDTEKNRLKLQSLLAEHDISQLKAAEIVSSETSRPLSLRAVQSWLAAPSHPSARGCPAWAVDVLEKHLKKKANKKAAKANKKAEKA